MVLENRGIGVLMEMYWSGWLNGFSFGLALIGIIRSLNTSSKPQDKTETVCPHGEAKGIACHQCDITLKEWEGKK